MAPVLQPFVCDRGRPRSWAKLAPREISQQQVDVMTQTLTHEIDLAESLLLGARPKATARRQPDGIVAKRPTLSIVTTESEPVIAVDQTTRQKDRAVRLSLLQTLGAAVLISVAFWAAVLITIYVANR